MAKDDNKIQMLLAAALAIAARACAALTPLYIVWIASKSGKLESYGQWIATGSLLSLITIGDLGINTTVANLLSAGRLTKKNVRVAFARASAQTAALLLVAVVLALLLPRVTGGVDLFAFDGMLTFCAAALAALTTGLLSIGAKLLNASGRIIWNNSLVLCGSLLAAALAYLGSAMHCPLPGIMFAASIGPLIFAIIAYRTAYGSVPDSIDNDAGSMRWHEVLINSVPYSGSAVLAIIGTSLDGSLLASFLTPIEVAHFGILQRVFQGTLFIQYMAAPLWPNLQRKFSKGDSIGARKAYFDFQKTAIWVGLLIIGITVLCWYAVLPHYIPEAKMVTLGAVVLFSFYKLICIYNEGLVALMMCTVNRGYLLKTNIAAVAIGVPLKIVLLNYFGIAGLAAALALSYLVGQTILGSYYTQKNA